MGPKSNFKPKPVSNSRSKPKANVVVKNNHKSEAAPVQKENRRAQQPTFKRTKSEANSLARGCELGNNVKKMFDDEPKTMDDYMERERIRRQKRAKKSVNASSSSVYKPRPKPVISSKPEFK